MVEAEDLEAHEKTVRAFYERCLASGDTSPVESLFAPTFVDHDPPGPGPNGIPGVLRVVAMFQQAMPRRTVTVHDLFAVADRVAIRLTVEGEQTGPFPGRADKRGPMRVDVIAILRLADRKIVERWGQARVT